MCIKIFVNADPRKMSLYELRGWMSRFNMNEFLLSLWLLYASPLIFNLCRATRGGMKYSASYLTGHYVRQKYFKRSLMNKTNRHI